MQSKKLSKVVTLEEKYISNLSPEFILKESPKLIELSPDFKKTTVSLWLDAVLISNPCWYWTSSPKYISICIVDSVPHSPASGRKLQHLYWNFVTVIISSLWQTIKSIG